jgi:hypothetical protein
MRWALVLGFVVLGTAPGCGSGSGGKLAASGGADSTGSTGGTGGAEAQPSDASGSGGNSLGPNCQQAQQILDDCSLLSSGRFLRCDEPVTEAQRCEYDCVAAAECEVVTQLVCAADNSGLQGCLDQCPPAAFECDDGTQTIPDVWRCDAEEDCDDASDEAGCTSFTRFLCSDGLGLPIGWRCDGEEDCADGSDEQGCPPESLFDCDDGGQVPRAWECDETVDCGDASDEIGCAQLQCPDEPRFSCANSVMIPAEYQCDGDNDCGDLSDESGCP